MPDAFAGFTPEDHAVFAIDGFQPRMAALRAQVRPKLMALGDLLAPALALRTGQTWFPHTAAHARRTVNPPHDTWVALGPSRRGYKMFPHLAVVIDADGLSTRFVLKQEAPWPRAALAAALRGSDLLAGLPAGCLYWDGDDPPVPCPAVDTATAAAHLQRRAATAAAGFAHPVGDPVHADPEALVRRLLDEMTALLPLYQASENRGMSASA